MKQNKNTCVTFYCKYILNRYLAFLLTLIVLFSSFAFFCSFGYATNTNAADIPVTGQLTASSSSYESAFEYYTKNAGGGYAIGNYGDADNMGCFFYQADSATQAYLYVITDTPNSHYCVMSESYNVQTQEYSYSVPTSGGNPRKYVIQSSNTIHPTDYPDVTLYISQNSNYSYPVDDGMFTQGSASCPTSLVGTSNASIADLAKTIYEAWNSPSVTSHSMSLNLPAGNAVIINITDNNGEALHMNSSSALRHTSPWSGNQTMGYYDSAPTSISTPLAGSHSISWTGTGSPNLFGGYNNWSLNGPLNPSKNYLVIVNPAYPNDNPDSITSNQATNGSISISTNYCVGYTIIPLSSYWNNGTIENESGSKTIDGVYDSNTESWVNTNPVTGEPENPVSGGMTNVDTENITINDWLQNISHQIGSFFSGAIGAVSNLVAAGSAFINSLISLYSWLPGPVYAVLSSALILVITIGVIKVFI